MHDDEQARRERADELRQQIEQLRSGAHEEGTEPRPGESPREYEERLERAWERRAAEGSERPSSEE